MEHSHRILTPRLLLRPLTEHDLERVRGWRNQENIRIWFQDDQLIQPEQHLSWYERYRTNANDMTFIAVQLRQEIPIGMGALYRIDHINGIAEFGRVLIGDIDYQGQGYGEEIVRGLTKFGLEQLGMNTVELFVKITNTRAIKAYMNCGYVHDRSYRQPGARGSSSLIRMICTNPHYRKEGRA